MKADILVKQFVNMLENHYKNIIFSYRYDDEQGFYIINHSYADWYTDNEFKAELSSAILTIFDANKFIDFAIICDRNLMLSYADSWTDRLHKVDFQAPTKHVISNTTPAVRLCSKAPTTHWERKKTPSNSTNYGLAA